MKNISRPNLKLIRTYNQSLETLPGLLICFLIAIISFALHEVTELKQFSPSIIAVIIGVAVGNLIAMPKQTNAGTSFSSKVLVRIAVALLGLQISISELYQFGALHITMTILALLSSFVLIKTIGKLLDVEDKLCELIAAGISICGAAAILGVNTATNADDDDVAYAIGMVTIFGTIAMLLYPYLGDGLRLSTNQFGIWSGISIHEVAQVVGAVSAKDAETIHIATITKLTRVLMLAPLVMLIKFTRSSGDKKTKVTIPLFVIAFIAFIIFANIFNLPTMTKVEIGKISSFLLTMALAAMGLNTKFSAISTKGAKPLILSMIGTLYISLFGLALIEFLA